MPWASARATRATVVHWSVSAPSLSTSSCSAWRSASATRTSLTTLAETAGAYWSRRFPDDDAAAVRVAGGKTLSQLSGALLRAIDPDAIAERASGKPGGSAAEVTIDAFEKAREGLVSEACAPFDLPALRDRLMSAKQDAEQVIDSVTIDAVTSQGSMRRRRRRPSACCSRFREYIDEHEGGDHGAADPLYSRPYKRELTEGRC